MLSNKKNQKIKATDKTRYLPDPDDDSFSKTYIIGVTRFELATSRPPAVRSNQTEPHPALTFPIIYDFR